MYDVGNQEKHMQVARVYITDDRMIFKSTVHAIIKYHSHIKAIEIAPTAKVIYIDHSHLPLHIPIHARNCRVLPHKHIIVRPFISFNVKSRGFTLLLVLETLIMTN